MPIQNSIYSSVSPPDLPSPFVQILQSGLHTRVATHLSAERGGELQLLDHSVVRLGPKVRAVGIDPEHVAGDLGEVSARTTAPTLEGKLLQFYYSRMFSIDSTLARAILCHVVNY